MKITRLSAKLVTKAFDSPLWNPRTVLTHKAVLLVFLETDSGLVGVGEAWVEGFSPKSTLALVENDIAPLVIGEDPCYVARIWDKLFQTSVASVKRGIVFAALSAVDIAIWDLLGKAADQPLYKLLGGFSDRVFVYASGGLYGAEKSVDTLRDEVRGYVAQGFRGVKIKIGGMSQREDVARVAAVREAIGPDIRLMVDAVYKFSVPEAVKMADALAPYDVYFFEAPVAPTDVRGLARVAARSPIPIAGNEFAVGLAEFRELVVADAVQFVHLDAILCGGVSEAMRIAALARAWHLPCSFHVASSAVSLLANLHVAAAIANADSVECHMVHRFFYDRLPDGSLRLEDGYLRMPTQPGLGIDLHPDRI